MPLDTRCLGTTPVQISGVVPQKLAVLIRMRFCWCNAHYHESRRGLLTMGLWTPMTIGRSKFLGVKSGGGPENQDEKMDRGVLWLEISILSLKMLNVECRTWENASKLCELAPLIQCDWLTLNLFLFLPDGNLPGLPSLSCGQEVSAKLFLSACCCYVLLNQSSF